MRPIGGTAGRGWWRFLLRGGGGWRFADLIPRGSEHTVGDGAHRKQCNCTQHAGQKVRLRPVDDIQARARPRFVATHSSLSCRSRVNRRDLGHGAHVSAGRCDHREGSPPSTGDGVWWRKAGSPRE